jgi:hypothetical protein
MKKMILLLACSLFLATLAFADPAPAVAPLAESEAIIINSHLKVISKTQHEENQSLYYTMDATYPQITGKHLSDAAQQFNQQVNKKVNDEIQQFKDSVKRDTLHRETLPESVRYNNLKIDYDIDIIHPDQLSLISVRLNIEGMQAGRAHPFHLHRVLNFDLTHGKELALSDLFKPKTRYLTALAKYSNTKLNASLQDKWMITKGAQPRMQNYKNWNIQADSILITFDEYQVAPYSEGPQEVEVPFSELQTLFSPQAMIISRANNAAKNIG